MRSGIVLEFWAYLDACQQIAVSNFILSRRGSSASLLRNSYNRSCGATVFSAY
jgi:hypothetical protein